MAAALAAADGDGADVCVVGAPHAARSRASSAGAAWRGETRTIYNILPVRLKRFAEQYSEPLEEYDESGRVSSVLQVIVILTS